jgi:putative nucleotide binding protein
MASESSREEHGIVLDHLSHGYHDDNDPTPLVQVVGKQGYKLLELIPKEDQSFDLMDDVYIGRGERPKIKHVKRKLSYDDLTSTAQGELEHAVRTIVDDREDEYVTFFNNAQPISTRSHVLQMLPGVGKKHLQSILKERQVESFTSYDDIADRVKALKDPAGILTKRIITELEGDQKRNLFAK